MSKKVLIIGANGHLGEALLRELGTDRAIAVTRAGRAVQSGFEHVELQSHHHLPPDILAQCDAVINAAGRIAGDPGALDDANILLPVNVARAAAAAGLRKMVQVSSFSIFGSAEAISGHIVDHPQNAYARSKLRAEQQLEGLKTPEFSIECMRLPFMFSVEKPALLLPLLKMATRLRIIPTNRDGSLQRSMITYSDAAKQLITALDSKRASVTASADPQFFTLPLLQTILAEEAGIKIRILPIPGFAVHWVTKLLPAVGRRLFKSSILDPCANCAGLEPLNLESELRAIVRMRFKK